jgi:hypothetical protein
MNKKEGEILNNNKNDNLKSFSISIERLIYHYSLM